MMNNLNDAVSHEDWMSSNAPSGDLAPKLISIKSNRFSSGSDEGGPPANNDGLLGFIDSAGSRIESISYGSAVPAVNGESHWQDDGDLSSNISRIPYDWTDSNVSQRMMQQSKATWNTIY